jgi:hypothetical protein
MDGWMDGWIDGWILGHAVTLCIFINKLQCLLENGLWGLYKNIALKPDVTNIAQRFISIQNSHKNYKNV